MTLNFDCGNQEALVGYLYDEQAPAERAAIAAHLLVCSRCAKDVAALGATRAELAAWTPPEVQLGFRVAAQESAGSALMSPLAVVEPSRWWRQPMPAWAQAAAAVLIFAVGAGLGALRGSANATPPGAAAVTSADAAVSPGDLAALEQRLRAEIAQLRPTAVATAEASTEPGAPVPAAAPASQAELLRQVRSLVEESEQRQQRELTLRTAAVIRDFDTQRRGDLARIEQTFGRMEGTTGVQVEQQRQVLNYLMRVSQQQP